MPRTKLPEPRPKLPEPRGIESRIRTMLQIRNLTVAKAAERCQLPVPTFETYLYGKNLPGAAGLLLLSRGLGCSADWLLGRGEAA